MSIRRWEIFELTFTGPKEGNPFEEQSIGATFSGPEGTKAVHGFYDGDGVYKVRFMPAEEGTYTYEVHSSFPAVLQNAAHDTAVHNAAADHAADFDAASLTGTFTVLPAAEGVHGPVRVTNKYHFAYADGTMAQIAEQYNIADKLIAQ